MLRIRSAVSRLWTDRDIPWILEILEGLEYDLVHEKGMMD